MYDENGRPLPEDPWSSIVDLMSALVLVLFLAVIFFITNFSEVSAALEAEKDTLNRRSIDLEATRKQLITANASNLSLLAREEKLLSEKKLLEEQQQRLLQEQQRMKAERVDLLQEQQTLKDERVNLLQEQTSLKLEKENLLNDQKRLLADKQNLTSQTTALTQQVLSLKQAIQDAANKQSNLMTALATSFEQAKVQGVEIDPKEGKIILKSEVLFSQGQSQLTTDGKQSLKGVSDGLIKVLNSSQFLSQVDGIMVEGHTSSAGKYLQNLNLSSERAINTLEFLLSLPNIKSSSSNIKRLFFAGAFGESKLVRNQDGTEDEVKSRRIEIRLLFNQSQIKSLTNAISQ